MHKSAYGASLDLATQRGYTQILENQSIDPDGKVLIYGYSYGGVLANYLSKRLAKVGIKVQIMVTVDAANGPWSDEVDRSIGSNVVKNVNYYEDNDSNPTGSNGGPNKGKAGQVVNHDMSKQKYNVEKMGRMNIDEASGNDAISSLNSVLRTLKPGEKKTLSPEEILKIFKPKSAN